MVIHPAHFIGIIQKKRYGNRERYNMFGRPHGSEYVVYDYWQDNFDEENPLWSGKFNNPILNKNDHVHIHVLNKTARIVDTVRSTDGSIIYYTDHVIKQIEDDETPLSKIKAEKTYEEWIKAFKECEVEPLPRSKPDKDSWWKF